MATPFVRKLVFKAAEQGSVDLLNDVIQQYGPLSKVIGTLTECNDEGDTPLHVAIGIGHHKVVEFLLAKIQECIVSNINVTHCKMNGHSSPMWREKSWHEMAHCIGLCQKVPVMYIMEHLIGSIMPNYLCWLDFVLKCVTASAISRSEKIVALELLGVAFIFLHSQHPPDKTGCHRGLHCWNEVMILRYSNVIIPKIPYNSSEIARNAYGDAVELMTGQELEQLLEEEASFRGYLKDWEAIYMEPLRIQALLVLERSYKNLKESPNSFHLKFLLDYVYECEARKQFTKVTNISLLILEECSNLNQSSSPKCIDIFIQTFIIIFDCLMQPNTSPNVAQEKFTNTKFLLIIKLSSTILKNLSTGPHISIIDPQLQKYGILKKFVKLIAVWLSWLNEEEQQQLEDYIHPFIRLNLPDGFSTPLHYAIWVFVSHGVVIRLNAVKLIQLFLRLGANPNSFDNNGKTPMHCLAHHWCWMIYLDLYLTVFQSLVDAGGRLDKTTPEGLTVMTILKEQRIKLSPHISRFDPHLESMMNTVLPFSLSDLCAQVIRHCQVAYQNSRLSGVITLFSVNTFEYRLFKCGCHADNSDIRKC